jgi:hypothetical protein
MLKIPTVMKDIFVGKIHGHFSASLSCSLIGVFAGYCQTALVGESGMINGEYQTDQLRLQCMGRIVQ